MTPSLRCLNRWALVHSSRELLNLRATNALKDLTRRAGCTAVDIPRQSIALDKGAVCILHTGPTNTIWLESLRAPLVSLGLNVCFLDAERMGPFDPAGKPLPYSIVVNRVSDAVPPPLARFVTSFLSICSNHKVPTLNGAVPYSATTSKIAQHGMFHASGLRCPKSFTVRCVADVEAALPNFPDGKIVFKPNAGSFGKGIELFDHTSEAGKAALLKHAEHPSAYGNDGIALLQKFHGVTQTHRVFVLADRVQASVVVSIAEGQFGGQCMASAAKAKKKDGGSAVEKEEISEEIRNGCVSALRTAGADVGSIEYLYEDGTNEPLYYDLNLLSTFPDAKLIGKDCWLELAEYIQAKSKAVFKPDARA